MAIYDQLKDIGKVLREADKIDQYQLILDIQQSLMDMQHKLQGLEEENSKLKSMLELKSKMFYGQSVYWIKNKEGKDGPYCPGCYDDKNKAIRLRPVSDYAGEYTCPICKVGFTVNSELAGNLGRSSQIIG